MTTSFKMINDVMLRFNHMDSFDLWEDYEFDNITKPMGFVKMSKKFGRKYLDTQAKRVYNEMSSSWYSINDIIFFVLTEYLLGRKFNYENITSDNIDKCKYSYTERRIEDDKEYVDGVMKTLGFESISKLFEITECGEPYILPLILNGSVSPAFYMVQKEILTKNSANTLFVRSDKFLRFQKISDLINKNYQITKLIKTIT